MPELKMKPTYKIFILDEDEFNDLHKYIPEVSKEDLKTGLGFANPKTREAYIKRTGVKELDDETIIHEAEELLAKHSTDEDENNIRWKRGGSIIRNIVSAVAVITGHPYIAAAMQAGGGAYEQAKGRQTTGETLLGTGLALAGGALGAGKAGGEAFKAAGGGLQGIVPSIKAGAGQLLGMTPATTGGAAATTNALAGLPAASGQGLAPSAAPIFSSISPGASIAEINTALLGSTLGSGVGSQLAQIPKVGTQTGAGQITSAPVTPSPKPFDLKSLATPSNILGAGSLLASQTPKQPEFQMPESVEAIRGKLLTGEGLTPLGQQARMELGTILKSTPQEIYPTGTDAYYTTVLKNLENEYLRQKQTLAQQWNAIDPNYQRNGEYILADDRLNKSYMEVRNNYVAQEEQRRFELGRTTKYQAIQDSLGVDKNVMDDLVGLTGLDVQTAAMIYGAQVQDVQTLRESLGTLGVELLMKGQGMQKQGAININLGGQTP